MIGTDRIGTRLSLTVFTPLNMFKRCKDGKR